jgi:predicted phage terminase large subunit-like protein
MKSTVMAKYKVDAALQHVNCRSCGTPQPLDAFRLFSTSPKRYMDFCVDCEKREGTLTLYRRFNAYGTKEIVEEVFKISRIPPERRSAEQTRILVEPKPVSEPETNEELVQREIARRDLARRRLVYFTTTMMPTYLPGWVHQDVCRRLERFMRQVEAGQSPRLMLAMPPRSGKSQLASSMFPSWVLGHHPDWPIILSSYAQELPVEFSRDIRDRLKDAEYQNIFPDARLRPDARGVEHWETTRGGGLKAIGVGGGLTGFGGKILIADDLIKDAEAASSEVIRKNTFDWYQMVFRTRLAPGGGILLIGTRWHWHDPQGRLLEIEEQLVKAGVPEYERENWEVVSYPAIAETDEYLMRDGTILSGEPAEAEQTLRLLRRKGEALHPERYPLSELLKIKNNTTTANWSALYQQHPTPEEGDFFKRDDIRYRWLDPAYRSLTRTFMCVDYAIGQKRRNDFTVMGVYALDADDDLYCLEKRRGRWGTDDIVTNAVALIERHKPEVYAGERGQIHEAVWPVIEKALREKRLYISVDDTLVPMQDKEVRARPLQGRMQRGKFFYSYDSATRPEIYDINERELLQFPNGAHDDCVDCDAWAARLALNTALPNAQSVPKKHASWKDKLTSHAATANSFMAA